MIYQWKAGSRFDGIDAQKVGEYLEGLRTDAGGLTHQVIIADAEANPAAPTRMAFTWDQAKAAHEYRLTQAAYLLRSLVRLDLPNNADAKPIITRAFVVVRETDGDQIYTATHVALADPELRAQVLARAFAELRAWQRKYADLEELAELFSVADRLMDERVNS